MNRLWRREFYNKSLHCTLVLLRTAGFDPSLLFNLHPDPNHHGKDGKTLQTRNANLFMRYEFKFWKFEVVCLGLTVIITWAAILPLIIVCEAAESRLPNLKRPLKRNPVVIRHPMGIRGFSLNFLISFSLAVSWCLLPDSRLMDSCLLS